MEPDDDVLRSVEGRAENASSDVPATKCEEDTSTTEMKVISDGIIAITDNKREEAVVDIPLVVKQEELNSIEENTAVSTADQGKENCGMDLEATADDILDSIPNLPGNNILFNFFINYATHKLVFQDHLLIFISLEFFP